MPTFSRERCRTEQGSRFFNPSGGFAMRFPHLLTLALIGLLCLGADGPPTMQEIQQDFDAQKYQDVLKKVSQALQIKGNAGQAYDRAALFKLKGEAHLRMKQTAPAADAF